MDASSTPGADRGYAVTLVLRSSKGRHLQPPLELPDGITADVTGPEIVLTLPVCAPEAAIALATARSTIFDLVMAFASTFNGFEFVIDERQTTRRTDAVYQGDGLPPPFDVAEGVISAAGAEILDPTASCDGWARS